ncbi:MAG: DUF1207 domain-containing protein [Planctomycetota bacterium]|jgi:hypothetical protein
MFLRRSIAALLLLLTCGVAALAQEAPKPSTPNQSTPEQSTPKDEPEAKRDKNGLLKRPGDPPGGGIVGDLLPILKYTHEEIFRPTWGRSAPAVDVERVTGWEWMAEGLLQPVRMADIRQPRFGLRIINLGRHRPQLDVATGIAFAPLRFTPKEQDAGWRFGIEVYMAAFLRFDLEHDTDLLGTDGYWGAPIILEMGDWVAKLEFGHISSHLGDETARTSGLAPIDYLKEEAILGLAWNAPWGFRPYWETGYALRRGHIDGPNGQGWWRIQWGLDWVPNAELEYWFPFFFGVNFESRQEVGWNVTMTIDLAVILWRGAFDQNLRFGVTHHRGRSQVMQFHTKRVAWWSFGFQGDF